MSEKYSTKEEPKESNDPKDQKEDPKKAPKVESVSLSKIYSLATPKERFIFYFSVVLSIVNAVSMPAMMFIWGDSTDAF